MASKEIGVMTRQVRRSVRAAPLLFSLATLVLPGATGARADEKERDTEGADVKETDLKREMSPEGRARHEQLMAENRANFEKQGVVAGQRLEDLEVHTLDGKTTRLSSLIGGKPTLLVSASLTCPVARERQPWVDRIAEKYGDRLNVAVVYTVEAHPWQDPSPYAELTPELENPERPGERVGGNDKAGLLRRQPKTLDERQTIAREFDQILDVEVPIVVDGMTNEAWQQLGGGPNMGLLVRPDGTVEVKHGWFDGETMDRSIEYFLSKHEAEQGER
jgi:hypothetical protein